MHNEDLPPGTIDLSQAHSHVPPEALARYLPELDDIEISEEQKLELLGILYSIMRSFVELGFDVASADIWGSISEGAPESPIEPDDSGTTLLMEETGHD